MRSLKEVYNPYSPYMPYKERYDIQQEPEVNTTLGAIDRKDANLEAEKGEVAVKPDLSGIYSIAGKRHSQGGTPLNLDPGSFIFSNDKDLHINPYEKKVFEFKGGGIVGKIDNTPARVLKREVNLDHYNRSANIIKDQDHAYDTIAKNSAQLMLQKYQEKMGQVAYVQESKKGFSTGVPDFSQGSAPVYNPKVKNDIEQNTQYMKAGGWSGFDNPYTTKMMTFQPGGQTGGYDQLFYPSQSENQFPGVQRGPVPLNPGQPMQQVMPGVNPPPPGITPNSFQQGTTLPYNPHIPLSSLQKANLLYSGYQAATVPRYNPYRSQVQSPQVELSRYNATPALNAVQSSAAQAYAANKVNNPYLSGTNNADIFGKSLEAQQQILGNYADRNVGVANQQAMTNNQIQRQDQLFNTEGNQRYYDQTQALAQNYNNEKRFATNQTASLFNDYLSKNQAFEQSLASQRTYGKVRVGTNPDGSPIYQSKPLFDVDTSGVSPHVYYTGAGSLNGIPYMSNRLYDFQAFAGEMKNAGIDPNSVVGARYYAATKGQPLQQSYNYQPQQPGTFKKGGTFGWMKSLYQNPYAHRG